MKASVGELVSLEILMTLRMNLRHPRIAFLLDNFQIGGTELHALRLTRRLIRDGFDVHILHLQSGGPLWSAYEAMNIPMMEVPIRGLASWGTVRSAPFIRKTLREWKVDVLHSHDIYGNILSVLWGRLAGVKVVTGRRWLDSVPRRGLSVINKLSHVLSSAVVANSDYLARHMRSRERIDPRKIVVIPNSVEEEAFQRVSEVDRDHWRTMHGLHPSSTVVGFVGRLSTVKNVELLLRAAVVVEAAYPEVEFVIVGDGPEGVFLKHLAAQLQLRCVHFTGELPSRPNIHQYFDVSVLCSLSEGAPNSLVEAAAAGIPVVATKVGGVSDIVEDGHTGLLVSSGDVEALARAIMRVIADVPLRQKLGVSAAERARSEYDEDRVVARLYELYAQLAAR